LLDNQPLIGFNSNGKGLKLSKSFVQAFPACRGVFKAHFANNCAVFVHDYKVVVI
jgi:hypothetical protein